MERSSGSLALLGTLRFVSYPAELEITLTRRTDGMRFIGNEAKAQTGMSVPPETCWVGPFLNAPLNLKIFQGYAAPMALRCWKHSRQNTGRPCVGRKGTVVSFPHCEQLVFVSERIGEA